MMKQRNTFVAKSNEIRWYDINDDWDLIESSFSKQYGIRIRQHTDMPWAEFCNLVSGFMSDTPLGQIIAIRSEDDKSAIKKFNTSQRKIHAAWKLKLANDKLENLDDLDKQMQNLEKAMALAFGSK